MILLDTNVLAELMRDPPEAKIVTWLNEQVSDDIWSTAVSVFEIRFGLSRLAEGRRRILLEKAFGILVGETLAGRIAWLDTAAAIEAADLSARRRSRGLTVDIRDTLIAGIALARRAMVATRNIRHFQDLETGAVNPWDD